MFAPAACLAKLRADSQRWILRHSAQSPPRADAPRTRRAPRTNSQAKKRESRDARVERHHAAAADRAPRATTPVPDGPLLTSEARPLRASSTIAKQTAPGPGRGPVVAYRMFGATRQLPNPVAHDGPRPATDELRHARVSAQGSGDAATPG